MRKVRKKEGKIIQAYCLGEDHPKLEELIKAGLLRKADDGQWRVLSREASEGEVAVSGDYIKLDSQGYPYPNSREFFLNNHRHLADDNYEQIPKVLHAWCAKDHMCEEVRFLIEHKELIIREDNEKAYFSAPLWGDVLVADKDAMIIFYDISYDEEQQIIDADFNFVAKEEYDKLYIEL